MAKNFCGYIELRVKQNINNQKPKSDYKKVVKTNTKIIINLMNSKIFDTKTRKVSQF